MLVQGEVGTYPGVDGLEAILRDIRISSYSTMCSRCRYLQFRAELGRNVDLHVCVKVVGRVLVLRGSAPQTCECKMQDSGERASGAGGCADYAAAQLVGLDG